MKDYTYRRDGNRIIVEFTDDGYLICHEQMISICKNINSRIKIKGKLTHEDVVKEKDIVKICSPTTKPVYGVVDFVRGDGTFTVKDFPHSDFDSFGTSIVNTCNAYIEKLILDIPKKCITSACCLHNKCSIFNSIKCGNIFKCKRSSQ